MSAGGWDGQEYLARKDGHCLFAACSVGGGRGPYLCTSFPSVLVRCVEFWRRGMCKCQCNAMWPVEI